MPCVSLKSAIFFCCLNELGIPPRLHQRIKHALPVLSGNWNFWRHFICGWGSFGFLCFKTQKTTVCDVWFGVAGCLWSVDVVSTFLFRFAFVGVFDFGCWFGCCFKKRVYLIRFFGARLSSYSSSRQGSSPSEEPFSFKPPFGHF
jgi:hypothetical protein